jgi:hypothetical protein
VKVLPFADQILYLVFCFVWLSGKRHHLNDCIRETKLSQDIYHGTEYDCRVDWWVTSQGMSSRDMISRDYPVRNV